MNIACFATQGTGSRDERRIRALLAELEPAVYPFDRGAKALSGLGLLRRLHRERPDLVVMEGTGVGGGLALLTGRLLLGTRYVVSTGDAVGPFMDSLRRGLGVPFGLYERMLLRCSAGVVAWSPYLAGRALTLGAPRAVTAAGWAPAAPPAPRQELRRAARRRLGFPDDALVFGLIGSLGWNRRFAYCYGLELVRAVRATPRPDVRVLIVGGGEGLGALERERAGDTRVVLTGPVSSDVVPEMLAAMDVASLPQSLDGVGSFRYTTKLSEYLAAQLPVVTGRTPLAYDLDSGWLWRLPGKGPWEPVYIRALAGLIQELSHDDIDRRRARVPSLPEVFDERRQRERVTAFLTEVG